jgi:hypothetical protein
MMAWAWKSDAPTAGGCGPSDDQEKAKKAAAKWMDAHGADRAVVEEVLIVSDAWTPLYVPVGTRRSFQADRDESGAVRWRGAGQTAAA